MPAKLEIIDKKFGRLTVLAELLERQNGSIVYRCLCICGKKSNIQGRHLKSGHTKSCGCLSVEKTKARNAIRIRKYNWNWKGGKAKHCKGYILLYAPEHPYSVNGYIFEHRLVMEDILGRYLMPSEVVHHGNGIKDDNSPKNLIYFPTESDHQKYESKLRLICKET